jgi:hypothetical protein
MFYEDNGKASQLYLSGNRSTADVLNFHFMSKEKWRPKLSGINLPAVHVYVPLKTIRDSFRVPLIIRYNLSTHIVLFHLQSALL